MKIIRLTFIILTLFQSTQVFSQDFQWLAEQETNFLEVSGNGDIYLVTQLPSIKDVDPGVDEWILDVNSGTWYLSKYNSTGSFEWAYPFEDAIVHSMAVSNNKVILTMSGGESTILHANNHNYSSTEKKRYAAIYNEAGDCTQLIHLDSRDATIESAHIDNDGSVFLTGTIQEEADFDTDIISEHVYQSYGDQSGFYAKYTDETHPDWVHVFEDYGAGFLKPAGIVGNDSSNLVWGFYTGNVDIDFTQSTHVLYDSFPNMTNFFIANYSQTGGLNWSQTYHTYQPSFESFIVDDVTFSPDEDIYITGRYKGNVFDTAMNAVLTAGSDWNSTFLMGFDHWGEGLFRYQLSNELETSKSSIIMNPENDGLWWIGSVRGTIDLDPTLGTYNVTTNVNPLSGSAQTHINAVYFTEFDLDGNMVKINYLNSEIGLFYNMARTNESCDFYMLAGGSENKHFDHNFGSGTYFDSTLTRSYIALYDGVRISEALGQKDENSMLALRFWPNPTQGLIQISKTPNQVRVYDLYGRQIQFSMSSNSIDLSKSAAGIYLVEVEINGFTEIFKVQKL